MQSAAAGLVPDYTVVFTRSARKELETLPFSVAGKIISLIEKQRTDARPKGALKLKGSDDAWFEAKTKPVFTRSG